MVNRLSPQHGHHAVCTRILTESKKDLDKIVQFMTGENISSPSAPSVHSRCFLGIPWSRIFRRKSDDTVMVQNMDFITYVSWFQRNCRWKSPRHSPSQTGQNMATSLTLRVAGLASVKAYEDSRGMIYVTWSIQAVKWMTNFEVQKRHDTGTNAHNYLGVPNWADGTADIMIIGSMSVYNPKYSSAKHHRRWHGSWQPTRLQTFLQTEDGRKYAFKLGHAETLDVHQCRGMIHVNFICIFIQKHSELAGNLRNSEEISRTTCCKSQSRVRCVESFWLESRVDCNSWRNMPWRGTAVVFQPIRSQYFCRSRPELSR